MQWQQKQWSHLSAKNTAGLVTPGDNPAPFTGDPDPARYGRSRSTLLALDCL